MFFLGFRAVFCFCVAYFCSLGVRNQAPAISLYFLGPPAGFRRRSVWDDATLKCAGFSRVFYVRWGVAVQAGPSCLMFLGRFAALVCHGTLVET